MLLFTNLMLAVCTCQTGDDVTNSSVLVRDVLDVQGVTRLAVSPTKVGISGTIWSLYLYDETINEEHDVVQMAIFRIHQILLNLS